MRIPPFYTMFCLVVLGLFAYSRYQGLQFDAGTGGTGGGGSGFHYVGVSGGYHK